ncbi:8-oxo-dGTP diphosphatase [Lactobacillus sp. ESL0731]|uniref:8-oxo-dGTP diphosphatase n=1 Tax=unclassified Lactobacillus TaxID=2620435 RepID=UPI0023F99D61|nr:MULTISPECIES: 8-oxo-dGTP diphosphatase [unclassified Lactobacillus]WEV50325.1 8-oxo-dGTP diphosphatase [Lactobacillus sp. ESL0700]WEV61454.1 8-oxo-dGTP diphosphatase [Lactobacillus sp. ESL0731]
MDRTERVTLTNMCMITSGDQILVLNRNDPTWPGLTFPGGHVEAHESFHDSIVREVKEETNLTISHPRLAGIKQFYDDNDHRYIVFFYIANEFTGKVKASNEGSLTWMSKDELMSHKLAYNFDRDLLVYFNEQIYEHLLDGKRDELF